MRLSSSGGSPDREWSFTWSPSCQGQPPAAWLTEGGLASYSLSVPPPARLERNKAITRIIMILSQGLLADSTISSQGANTSMSGQDGSNQGVSIIVLIRVATGRYPQHDEPCPYRIQVRLIPF
jgi:hypothetical protein